MPQRLQRKRTRGWRKPEGAVIVTRPSRWGNPFIVGVHGNAEECVALYRRWLTDESEEALHWRNSLYDDPTFKVGPWDGITLKWANAFEQLRGKDLVCYCKVGQPCHADVLLELANAERLEPMGAIVKLGEYYLEWSSVTDAPNTYGMNLDELKEYVKEEWGQAGLRRLELQLERVEKYGTSSFRDDSAVATIWLNRAGPGESTLTIEGIYRHYCLEEPVQPEWIVPGRVIGGDDDDDGPKYEAVVAGWPLPEMVQTP